MHDGVVCELPDAGRRDTQRPRLYRARARRHAGRTPERLALRRPGHPRLAQHVLVHDAAGVLLQGVPAAPLGVARGRAVHPVEGGPRRGPSGRGPRLTRGGEPPLRRVGDRRRLGRARRGRRGGRGGSRHAPAGAADRDGRRAGGARGRGRRRGADPDRDAGVRRVRRATRGGRESPRPVQGPPAAHRVRDRGRGARGRVPEQRSAGDRPLVGGGTSDRDLPRPPGPAGGCADVQRGGVSLGSAPQGCRLGRDHRRPSPRRAGRDRRCRRASRTNHPGGARPATDRRRDRRATRRPDGYQDQLRPGRVVRVRHAVDEPARDDRGRARVRRCRAGVPPVGASVERPRGRGRRRGSFRRCRRHAGQVGGPGGGRRRGVRRRRRAHRSAGARGRGRRRPRRSCRPRRPRSMANSSDASAWT